MDRKIEQDFIPYEAKNFVSKGSSLILAPHPDDEVFGCGGAIIRHVQQGDKIKVCVVTDGGFAVTPEQDKEAYPVIRKKESIAAANILGYGMPLFLNYPDRGIADSKNFREHIHSIISDFHPENIYLPALSEIHPDHYELGKIVTNIAKQLDYTTNLIYYEIGSMQKANLLHDITDIQGRLEKAMDCFESQLKVQEYKRHIIALHIYRTYTLPKYVKYAEAYNIVSSREIAAPDE